MARFVLIEIPDNADADAFVSAVKNGAVIFGRPAPDAEVEVTQQEVVYGPLEGTKVEGLFGAPTKFCECPDYPGTSARSKTYGWYVHVKCGMPRKGAMQHPYNLLERDLPVTQRRYYIGFRADRRGWRLTKDD